MLDPVPPPPSWLANSVQPIADLLSFPTLPYHIHEIVFALVLYTFVQTVLSPRLSSYIFPKIYPNLNARTKLNWDVHVVSMVQSCLIDTIALWVIFTDQERKSMTALERIYGYTGGCGLVQGLATGYFLWDLIVTTAHIDIFGPGLVAHGLAALMVFSFGFRPFSNYYGPTFILYELSSPFLNVHWFCDKLGLTGSKLQWYNGMILLATFFGSRLVWGLYQATQVFQDMWYAMHLNTTSMGYLDSTTLSSNTSPIFVPRNGELCLGEQSCVAAQAEVMRFSGPGTKAVPLWLVIIYFCSNLTLNLLNIFWFGRMIETVTKRFRERSGPPADSADLKRRPSMVLEVAGGLEHDDRMHGSMVLEDVAVASAGGVTSGLDGGVGVRKR